MSEFTGYEVYYHPGFHGRSAAAQLLLIEANEQYKMMPCTWSPERVVNPNPNYPVFAPPCIKKGDFVLSQTPAINSYLGKKHGFAPASMEENATCDQLGLDASDIVVESFANKSAEKREAFLSEGGRLASWLGHFEKALGKQEGPFLFGETLTHADFTLWGTLSTVLFLFEDAAFPPAVKEFHSVIGARDSVVNLLAKGEPMLPDRFK